MKWFSNFRRIKYFLVVLAAVIAASSLYVSNALVEDLKREEELRMTIWASAMSSLINAEINEDVTLEQEILSSNTTIPVILTDENGSIIQYNNIEISPSADTLSVLMERAAAMRSAGKVIPWHSAGLLRRLYDSYTAGLLPIRSANGCTAFFCYMLACNNKLQACRTEPCMGRAVQGDGTPAGHAYIFASGVG